MNKEILNKYIDLIDKGYCCDCNELNCIDNFPHAKITRAIRELQQENQELKLELSGYRQAILENKDMLGLKEESEELKKQLEEYENEPLTNKISRIDCVVSNIYSRNKTQQKDFIEWLENEEDRLARECSHMYKNSLGKTRLVNEDIFNEVDTILSKYKEIIGDDK